MRKFLVITHKFLSILIEKVSIYNETFSLIIIIIIKVMSVFIEDNIFSKYTNLTYGPLKSITTNIKHRYIHYTKSTGIKNNNSTNSTDILVHK